MNKVIDFIEAGKEKQIDELITFLKIPSVSSQPEHTSDMLECAEWLKNHMVSIGITNSRIISTPGHPIVYGELLEAGPDAKTVLIYGHYDVQPVDPIELWDSDPFDPQIKNGKIVGRGTADDKGQLFIHLKAVEAFIKTNTKIPINLKFIFEGEEEAGSSNLDTFIVENKELLSCDAVLVSDTEWFADGLPSLCYGLRGISFVEVFLKGPNRDLHSGTFGGAIDNPVNVLCSMISKLKDEYGRMTIPGFYDNVLELTDVERQEFKRLPYNESEYCKDLDITGVNGEFGFTTLERTWARPSLDVNGMKGGYIGDGAKTVLPSEASAKISMRLVPNQDAKDITKKITDYLISIAPPTVKVVVKALHGGNPVLFPIDSDAVKAAINSLRKAFGKDPVFMREGGSIPITELFDSVLNAPTVLLGFGLPGDNIHSPNENFDINNFYGGIKASAYFIDEYSKIQELTI